MSSRSSMYSLWDVVKFRGDYFFVLFDTQDKNNATILVPRGGPPPPSAKMYNLHSMSDIVSPHHLIPMVKDFLSIFGHVAASKDPSDDLPQPCSLADFKNIKDMASYFDVD